jgi:hypothetical protein
MIFGVFINFLGWAGGVRYEFGLMDDQGAVQGGGDRASFRRLILRGLVTVVTLVAAGLSVFATSRQLPFHADMKSSYAVVAPRRGVELPAGMAAGDRIPLAAQSMAVRAVLMVSNVPGDRAYAVVVEHGGREGIVLVRSVAVPDDGFYVDATGQLTLLALLIVGLTTLWRGRDWAAWGLSLFALSVIVGSTFGQVPLPPYGNVVGSFCQYVLTGQVVFLGLFLTAGALIGRDGRVGRRALWAYIGFVVVGGLFEFAQMPLVLWAGHEYAAASLGLVAQVIALVALAVPLVMLMRGFVAARPDQRLRIKWVLTGSVLLVPLLLIEFWSAAYVTPGSGLAYVVEAVRGTLGAVALLIYAFAVLSTRLVDVRIAINRAVVFTVLMGLVVGLLALVESVIENSALHGRAGLALEVAAPLVLGIAFDQLQRRIEQVVDRVFFRREHKAREAMREFVRDAGFVERAEVLVGRIVAVFHHHSGGHGAALFEVRSGVLERTAQHGHRWPEVLDGDDAAMVRLRATLAPLDLHGIGSAIGAEGVALPLGLRGRLFGVIVCGPRSAGRYSQAEMGELGQAAREVGASLFALRARANEALIERIALGQMALTEATVEARQLSGFAP